MKINFLDKKIIFKIIILGIINGITILILDLFHAHKYFYYILGVISLTVFYKYYIVRKECTTATN